MKLDAAISQVLDGEHHAIRRAEWTHLAWGLDFGASTYVALGAHSTSVTDATAQQVESRGSTPTPRSASPAC